jgi:WD40 repeat protein
MSIDFYPNSNYFVTSSLVKEFDSGIRFWKLKKKPTFNFTSAAQAETLTYAA